MPYVPTWVLAVVALVLVLGWYLSYSAGRLDRLHHRVETLRAALDAQLARRGAARPGEAAPHPPAPRPPAPGTGGGGARPGGGPRGSSGVGGGGGRGAARRSTAPH